MTTFGQLLENLGYFSFQRLFTLPTTYARDQDGDMGPIL